MVMDNGVLLRLVHDLQNRIIGLEEALLQAHADLQAAYEPQVGEPVDVPEVR